MLRVDRNTIARTAPIAEMRLCFLDVFEGLPRDEKMSTFAAECRAAITPEMAAVLKAKKKTGELLPIKYKVT